MLARLGVEITLTTNGALLAAKAEALAAAGLRRITVSLDSLDDEPFRAMNDVDFPVQTVLAGIDAAREAGLPVKVNCVVKRGVNEHQIIQLARHFRGHGGHASLHRVHGRRPHERLANGRRRPRRGDRRVARPGARRRACRARLSRGGRPALPLPRRLGRGRRDRLDHAAVLRRLHPRAVDRRGEALHLPLRDPRPRPPRAAAGRRLRPTEIEAALAGIWRVRDDRYSEIRTEATAAAPKVEMSYIGG